MAEVGVIIPSYNAARFLPQTIQSVREQTFADFECVIVDDCSQDDSREIARSACAGDGRFSVLCLPANVGTSAARNAGLAALGGKGRYVIFLDSDDVWNTSSLRALVDAMQSHPSWAAVFGNCRLVDPDGTHVGSVAIESACREMFDYRAGRVAKSLGTAETSYFQFLFKNPVVSPGCMLIRADVIAKIAEARSALFDAGLTRGEDLDAWLRVRRAGGIGHLDQVVLDYRRHSCNKSNRRWKMAISTRRVRLRALSKLATGEGKFHEACAGMRAYRAYRMRREIRSAGSCLAHGQLRGGGVMLGCAVASATDILIVLLFQASRWATAPVRDRGGADVQSEAVAAGRADDLGGEGLTAEYDNA